jgi:hypothetical protein
MYVGTHTRLKIQPITVAVAEPAEADFAEVIEIITDAAGIHTYKETQTVYIHFPPEKIWLLGS